MEYKNGDYTITTERDRLDIDMIHSYLSGSSYWAKGIPRDVLETSIRNSLNFGLFYQDKQIGFARVITDYATVAYLGDVFVLAEYRGRGQSKWLMDTVMAHPELQGLRRWILLTSDAHGLYEKSGWQRVKKPQLYMELHNPDIYKR